MCLYEDIIEDSHIPKRSERMRQGNRYETKLSPVRLEETERSISQFNGGEDEAARTLSKSLIYLKSMAAVKSNANELKEKMKGDKFSHVKSRLSTRNESYIRSKTPRAVEKIDLPK
jgi:hypothetical protein